MPRHRPLVPDLLPPWVKSATNDCLISVAEEAYAAQKFADEWGAFDTPSCEGPLRAAAKSLAVLNDERASSEKRCAAGERAARKFWEAKVCARQRQRGVA